VSEPVTPAGWTAILAAVLLPAMVALLWTVAVERNHRAQDAVRVAEFEARILEQERTIAGLRQQVQMLEEDLDSVIEFD